MQLLQNIRTLIYISSLALGSLATAASLCPEIIDTAGGGPPNSGIPTVISASAIAELQLAQFLENLEVSFFNNSLINIGRWGTNEYANDTVEIVSKIAAQEEVHLESLANLLTNYNAVLIPPCNYSFPMNSTAEFFALADLITSVGIGATIGLSQRIAATDPLLVGAVSSILTVESRHDAFFRHIQGEVPNPAPFDTGISGIWAYNLALLFIVPGSCQVEVPVPILPTLTVAQPACAKYSNSTGRPAQREFTWDPTQTPFVAEAGKQLLIGWVNQLNKPIYTPLNITAKGKGTAYIPQEMNGAAFAAVTVQQPDNVNDLTLTTMAGPVIVLLS